MKFLFALDKYSAREGGADRFAKAVVAALLGAGHGVRVLQAGKEESEEIDGEFSLKTVALPQAGIIRDNDWQTKKWNHVWQPLVEREIGSYRPDQALTQNRLTPATVAAAKKCGVESTIFFHGYRCLSPTFFMRQDALTCAAPSFAGASLRHKFKWPLIADSLRQSDRAYRDATRVIANSDYIAKVIRRFFERAAEVLYPVIDLGDFAPHDLDVERKYSDAELAQMPVLFLKPQEIKGLDLVLELAKRMPHRAFHIAGHASGRLRRRLESVRNIRYSSWLDDIGKVYAESAMLLAPSQIPEPFGRVAVEAGLYGVPCVVSDFGGLPEAMGPGGVAVPFDAGAGAWGDAIEKMYDAEVRASFSSRGRSHALDLTAKHNPAKLVDLLTAC